MNGQRAAALRAFVATGAWPDRTMFVLEIRTSEHTGSIVTSGHYQTDLIAVESEIKDARIPGGWGYFSFNTDEHGPRGAAKRLPETQACYGCHTANGAVEHTFTQFYPTLLPIARAHGTVRSDFVGIPPSVEDMHTQILAGGYTTARAAIDATATKWPEASIAKEVSLHRLGYRLVQEHRVDAALEVFADITRRFPDSASAWDSYSETLEGAGKLAAAAEATAKGLAAIAQMPAGPRRDEVDQALHERAARLSR